MRARADTCACICCVYARAYVHLHVHVCMCMTMCAGACTSVLCRSKTIILISTRFLYIKCEYTCVVRHDLYGPQLLKACRLDFDWLILRPWRQSGKRTIENGWHIIRVGFTSELAGFLDYRAFPDRIFLKIDMSRTCNVHAVRTRVQSGSRLSPGIVQHVRAMAHFREVTWLKYAWLC